MAEDFEVVELETGEIVREYPDGRRILVPGPSPVAARLLAMKEDQAAEAAILKQKMMDKIEKKRAALADNPSVPPEKRPL